MAGDADNAPEGAHVAKPQGPAAPPPGEITGLLRRVETGDRDATSQLAVLVHADLRRMAATFLAGERAAHTLQPTALGHEAWLRIVPAEARHARGRAHFMAIAARAMRQILVDYARARGRQKRGGGWQRVSFSEMAVEPGPETTLDDLLDLDRALEGLGRVHERAVRVVELRSFAGCTIDEAAEALGVSHVTVEGDWAFAKAWLFRALRDG